MSTLPTLSPASTLLVSALCLLVAPPVSATGAPNLPPPEAYLMDEAEERRLARTAAPPEIGAEAALWLLRPSGYELVEEGTNGFHCFVERSWSGPDSHNRRHFDPRVRAPHCINPEGARTTMRDLFLVSELAMQGLGQEEIDRRVDAAYARGDLRLPTRLSLTYMMSAHQWLGQGVEAWHPHVMLWIPWMDLDEVGPIGGRGVTNAVLGGTPGSRRTVLIFPVPDFVGGEEAHAHPGGTGPERGR